MVTFCTYTEAHKGDAPKAPTTPADKSAGSITIHSDGSSTTKLSRGAVTVDSSDGMQSDKAASKSGPLSTPIRFYKKSGLGGSVADAEANPKDFKFAQGGTKVSLQTALNAGLVKKHADGNYYDYRADPSFKSGGSQQQPDEDQNPYKDHKGEEAAPDALSESGFEMSEEGSKAVGKLQEINTANPDLVDDALTRLVSSNGDALNESKFIEQIAGETGMSKDETAEVVSSSISEYRAAAASVIETAVPGLDGQDFLDHVRQHNPQVADRMVYSQMNGDFSPHIKAAKDYLVQLPKYDQEAALNADLGPHAKSLVVNGQVMVDINGRRYTWADAMRKFR